jgi:hypothetical protein
LVARKGRSVRQCANIFQTDKRAMTIHCRFAWASPRNDLFHELRRHEPLRRLAPPTDVVGSLA